MSQEDKIVQISGSGDVVFALTAEGKLYVGTLNAKLGFEWRRLPEMNPAKIKAFPVSIMAESDDASQPVFAPPPGGEIKTASLLRDDPPAEETAKNEAGAEKK